MPDMWLWFFILFVGGFFALDAYRYFLTERPTFSQKMREWNERFPFIAFWIGILLGTGAGHLWW